MTATEASSVQPLRMGIIGLGQGALGVIPTMAAMPEVELIAATARNPSVRAGFLAHFPEARAYPDIESLCADPDVDAVWISTPNRLHCEHALIALRAGKHVAVDKPMAVTLEEADSMIATAQANGVKLLAGHTDSLSLPLRAVRKVAVSGQLGKPQAMFVWSYTDWMLRPRTPDELSPASGAGIVHRQVPHQADTIRLIGGGMLRSVRASVGQWMPERPAPGFYNAFLEFENGMPATIMHNGHGYFTTLELYPEAKAHWRYTEADRIAIRRRLRSGARDDVVEKRDFQIGGERETHRGIGGSATRPWSPFDVGMLVVSCERGDVLCGRFGPLVYGDDGRVEYDLRGLDRGEMDLEGGGAVQALLELHGAVRGGKPLYHSGEWGRATLEVAVAIVRSAQERREIFLERQVPMPPEYDADLILPPPNESAYAFT